MRQSVYTPDHSTGRIGPTLDLGAPTHARGRPPRYLIPAALVALLAAVIIAIVTALGGSNTTSRPTSSRAAPARKLPPYWTVRPGQTYSQIAQKTGLSVDQLERLNPSTDPYSLVPGQRLRLGAYGRRPRPRRLGPRFWTVRSGQSFGSIAAKTGHSIVKLERLNPRLKPTTLQPGDKVRLRH